MSVAMKPAPPQPTTQDVNSSSAKSDSLTSAFRQLQALASCDSLQSAAEIIRQLDHQQKQIRELEEKEKKHIIAMEVMASKIEKDKKRQSDAEANIESLHKMIADKEKALSEYSQKLDSAANDTKKLKSEKSLEAAKVLGLSADITSLQKVMKDREASINRMIASESSIKDLLTSEQKRTGQLKQECESLRVAMEASQVKLGTLESFRGPYQEMDENLM